MRVETFVIHTSFKSRRIVREESQNGVSLFSIDRTCSCYRLTIVSLLAIYVDDVMVRALHVSQL
jgi:hypothetical protein